MTDYRKSKLPFKIVSSSVNTGYITEISSGFKPGVDIVGHHQDTYAGLENEPLQSPFTNQHVGGNQHRHIPINTGVDYDYNRPEAFKISLTPNPVAPIPATNSVYYYIGGPGEDFVQLDFTAIPQINDCGNSLRVRMFTDAAVNEISESGFDITISLQSLTYLDDLVNFINNNSNWLSGVPKFSVSQGAGSSNELFYPFDFYNFSGGTDGIGNENPAKTLRIYGPDFEDVNKPRAQMWRGAKSPINISNIKTIGNIAGNFEQNYQVVQTSGRGIVNNLIVDGFESTGQLTTQFISGANKNILSDIVRIDSDGIQYKDRTTIVERFNSPGSKEESSRGALDRAGEEKSPNNSLTTRNIKVRQPFYSQLTQHSPQFGSGSVEGVSIHKVNRNRLKRMELDGELEASSSLYDNFWVQHNIPSSQFGYAWVTSSTISNPYTIGSDSLQFDITGSVSKSKDKIISLDTQTIIGSLSSSDSYYSTWKQIRTGDHPVARKLRQSNIIAVENEPLPVVSTQKRTLNKSKRSGTSTNFVDPSVTNKNYPLEQDLQFVGEPDRTSTKLKYTFKNNSTRFANEDLDYRLGLSDKEVEFYNNLVKANNLEIDSPIKQVNSIKFKETFYPRELNTFLSGTRGRTAYVLDQAGTGSDGYDIKLGTQRVIWRDDQENRKRSNLSSGGYINSVGELSTQETGSSFDMNAEEELVDGTAIIYTSSFDLDENINKGLFNSIKLLETSSSTKDLYLSFQKADTDKNSLISHKKAFIGNVAGEFNEAFIDSYGLDISGSNKNSLGTIYRSSLYKTILTQRPYKSGSVQDLRDSVPIIPTEDDQIVINPKVRYVSFVGGAELSKEAENYNIDNPILFDNERNEDNIVFTTLDNGLIRTTEIDSGKNPSYDSYEDFSADIRAMGKDYSVIPEFKISSHMKYYINSSAGNFRNKNNAIFELDGNGISKRSASTEKSNFNVNFKEKYLITDKLENNTTIEKDYSKDLETDSISLVCKGIKKLLPYNGFYPQDRTVQIAGLYSDYVEKNLYGGTYNVGYEDTVRTDQLFLHPETDASLARVSSLSSLEHDGKYYVAVGYNYWNGNRGLVKIFSSSADVPFENWNQTAIKTYQGSLVDSYFGQSVLLLSASNGINLFVSEFTPEKTGSIYQMTSADGTSWSSKSRITSNTLPITGGVNLSFGNYIDGIVDNQRTIVTINELGLSFGVNNTIYASYLSGTDLYLGGAFTNVDNTIAKSRIVKYDTINKNFSALANGINDGIVYCITGSGSSIYVGGTFNTVNNTTINKIAKYDTATNIWSSSGGSSIWNSVKTIAVSGNYLYVGGDFGTTFGSRHILKRDIITGGTSVLGSSPGSTTNGVDSTVNSIVVSGNYLYVGGNFTSAFSGSSTTTSNRIAKWDILNKTWSALDTANVIQEGSGGNTFISASDKFANDYFGNAVTINSSGNRIFVGAKNANFPTASTINVDDSLFSGSYSIAADFTSISNLFMSHDGQWLFVCGGNKLIRYALSTPYKIDSLNISSKYILTISLPPGSDKNIKSVWFNSTGLKMYILVEEFTSTKVGTFINKYNLLSPYDIINNGFGFYFSLDDINKPPGGQSKQLESLTISPSLRGYGLFFNPLMSKMFVSNNLSSGNSKIRTYTLSTPADLTSINTSSFSDFTISSSVQNNIRGLWFDSSGTVLTICGTSQDTISQYSVSIPFDLVTTPAVLQYTQSVSQDTSNVGIFLDTNNINMYVLGSANKTIYQHTLYTSNAGKVYVYNSGSTGWTEEKINNSLSYLSASFIGRNDYFGSSVAVNNLGNRLLVSSPLADIGVKNNAGKVYLYYSGSSGWTNIGTSNTTNISIVASDNADSDTFGSSLAIDGDGKRFIVGAPLADILPTSSFTDAGKVYIFNSGSSTGWIQETIGANVYLSASDKAGVDNFGSSVAINNSGNRIFVGANQASYSPRVRPGKVYIFNSGSSTGWVRETISGLAYLKASDAQDYDFFGSSLSADSSGNRLVVSAPRADTTRTDAGKVYIFNSSSTGWIQETILSASDNNTNDYFGSSIEISGDGNTIIVGSPSANTTLIDSGKVYVYVSSSSGWIQQKIYSNPYISASDKLASDKFGTSVSIVDNGKRIVVGSPYSDNVGGIVDSGKVYTYYTTSSMTQKPYWYSQGGLNASVHSLILSGSDIYAGGSFTSGTNQNITIPYNRVVKYSPNIDSFSNLADGLNNTVITLVKSGSDIYAGGSFTVTGSRLSKWDGTSWSSPAVEALNSVSNTIVFSGSNIYVGGTLNSPSKNFAIYDTITSLWLQGNGSVYAITSSNNINWSSKVQLIKGANFAKYSSIVSASNGYHVFSTNEFDSSGSIMVVTSSNGGITWSSGSNGEGKPIVSGSDGNSYLGMMPVDATVFNNGTDERIYLFTAESGSTLSDQKFFVVSSSAGSVWSSTNALKTTLLTGSIITNDFINRNRTNLNISSLSVPAGIFYSYGVPNSANPAVYLGKSSKGTNWEKNDSLLKINSGSNEVDILEAVSPYFGENIDISTVKDTPVFFLNDDKHVYTSLSSKFVAYRLRVSGNQNYVKHAALEPFFAPGILYNTIKSGIAVDWPCTTGSNVVITSSGDYGLRSAYYPKNKTIYSTVNDNGDIVNAVGSLKSNINYRIPFESIIFPNEAFEPKPVLTSDRESLRLLDNKNLLESDDIYQYLKKSYIYSGYEPYLDPLDTSDIGVLGPKRHSVPFVYRRDQTSDSGLFTLSVSNFLAETIKFFLKDEKLVTFNSLPDNKWKQFKQGITYYMDVVIEKTPDLIMMESYHNDKQPIGKNGERMDGRYFGYPTNKTTKQLWFGQEFTTEEAKLMHNDPAYAPYTPPYFEGVARARISFTPDTSGAYTLEQVLSKCNIENIYPNVEIGAEAGSDALVNKMKIDASLDLKGSIPAVDITIRTDENAQQAAENANNKIWVISPRMETPILDFSSQDINQFVNSYTKTSGYGRGMWSGYGEVPSSGKGVRVRLEYPFARENSANSASLLDQIGFAAEEKYVGRIAESKTISESIIAIPYLENETEQTVKNKTSFRASNINFIKIDEDVFKIQRKNIENGKPAISSGQLGQDKDIQSTTISDMIQKMKNYIIPPELNFLEYSDLKPHIMYIFEFTHDLNQQDLADIWQGVMPGISINPEKDEITINHKIEKYEMFGGNKLPENLKWIVFKVKKKSEYNYFNVTATTKDDDRFQFNKIIGRKQGTDIYSYNWPYDFFSLVELAKLDIEINYKKKDK